MVLNDRRLVVIDEAYTEFADDPGHPDFLGYIREGRRLLTMRTFSKFYALAGLRIGYGIANEELTGYMNRVRQPFNTNSIAQAAAIAALKDREHIEKSDDNEEAREKALEKAKEEAILQAVSKYVNPEIISKEKERLINIFKPRQDEIIDRYEIISEEVGEDGIYRIKISAKLREDITKTLLMKNLYNMLLVCPVGQPRHSKILAHCITPVKGFIAVCNK